MSNFIEITKKQARERYDDGNVVRLMASNLNPHSYWGEPLPVNKECGREFEKLCNEFRYYNCTRETGKKIRFYITEEEQAV